MNKFVGSTHDGSDCAFQYPWGVSGCLRNTASQTPAANRERDIITEVLVGFWNRRTDYSKFVPRGHWMDGTHLLLVIVYMYKIPMLVLFDNQVHRGRHVFYTYIYTYNETIPSVNLKIHDGIMEHICPTGAACIIFIDDQSHYMFFEYSEVYIE
jgi:hypothetical protein